MGLIFDKINAEVAAREGLIAAAGVGRIHLLPVRDRSLVEKRTRNIRAIRNDAAAKLGVLPSQIIQADPDGRGLRDFRIDFHRKGGAIDPRGRYSIFATATDLSSNKRYVVGNAEHERLRLNAAPTGRRTANVIGTDDLGEPVYEVVEDPQAALLSHLAQQVVRHLKPVIVGSAEAKALGVVEWGSTVDTVYPVVDAMVRRNTGGSWSQVRDGVGTTAYAQYLRLKIDSDAVTDQWDEIQRSVFRFDLSAYTGSYTANICVYGNNKTTTFSSGGFDVVFCPSSVPTGAGVSGDYDIGNHTLENKGSLTYGDISTVAYNVAALDATALNPGGDTHICMMMAPDFNNSPSWEGAKVCYIYFEPTETVGTAKDPYLELTTAAAAAASGGSMISPLNLISRLGR